MNRLRSGEIQPKSRLKLRKWVECPVDPATIRVGEVCGVQLSRLRPTQATVGYVQVYEQSRKLARMGERRLADALFSKPIPVVLGPDRQIYVLDHHHHAASLLVLGSGWCVVEMKERCLQLSERAFWAKMRRNKWLHLYDEHGRELDHHGHLPDRIARLKDNIYQSVAWATRKRGGFTKSAVAVSDFKWPDFFRRKLGPVTARNFRGAVKKAVGLALSPEAKGLPGRIRGREELKEGVR